MVAFDQSLSSLFSDVSPGLPTYRNHNVTQFTLYSLRLFSGDRLRTPTQNVQLATHNSNFQSLNPPRKLVITYATR